jgi:hypothetical protein
VPEFTVNISPHAHETLLKLAESSGEAIQIILDKAIENYRRQSFLLEANRAFMNLRENDVAWLEELQERQIWEQTIADGLEEY